MVKLLVILLGDFDFFAQETVAVVGSGPEQGYVECFPLTKVGLRFEPNDCCSLRREERAQHSDQDDQRNPGM